MSWEKAPLPHPAPAQYLTSFYSHKLRGAGQQHLCKHQKRQEMQRCLWYLTSKNLQSNKQIHFIQFPFQRNVFKLLIFAKKKKNDFEKKKFILIVLNAIT